MITTTKPNPLNSTLNELLAGNLKYAKGHTSQRISSVELKKSQSPQAPKAVILSCLDSRVPVENIFDQGVGDLFVARVAGNVVNDDIIGSMEFATVISGTPVIIVLAHTGCGAVHGACAGAELGKLTGLLKKIQLVIPEAKLNFTGVKDSSNPIFVDYVAECNARKSVRNIRRMSPSMAALEKQGHLKIVPAIYDLNTQRVSILKN